MLLSAKKVFDLVDDYVNLDLKFAWLKLRIPKLLYVTIVKYLDGIMDRDSAIKFHIALTEVIYEEFNKELSDGVDVDDKATITDTGRNQKAKEKFVVKEMNSANSHYKSAKDMVDQHNCNKNVKHSTLNQDKTFFNLLYLHGTIGNSLMMESGVGATKGKDEELFLVIHRLSQILEQAGDHSEHISHEQETIDLVNSVISLVKGQLELRKQRIEFSKGRCPQDTDKMDPMQSTTTSKGYIHDFKFHYLNKQKWTIQVFPSFTEGQASATTNFHVTFPTLLTWGNVGLSSTSS